MGIIPSRWLGRRTVIYGGGQEGGLRAGTENVPYAVALGAAADLARAEVAADGPHRLAGPRDRLHDALAEAMPGDVELNGHPQWRLPNTVNVSLAGVDGTALLSAVPDIAASTGPACHAGSTEPSPVLAAMGLDRERALGAKRLSVGRWTPEVPAVRSGNGPSIVRCAIRRLGHRCHPPHVVGSDRQDANTSCGGR